MKSLGGKGELFSFEYNKERAEQAKKEFEEIHITNVM
jgi:tRNA A58 N-methylase Trm61